MKKIGTVLLAIFMAFVLTFPAFAEETELFQEEVLLEETSEFFAEETEEAEEDATEEIIEETVEEILEETSEETTEAVLEETSEDISKETEQAVEETEVLELLEECSHYDFTFAWNETEHYSKCDICNEVLNKQAHDIDPVNGMCEGCGYILPEFCDVHFVQCGSQEQRCIHCLQSGVPLDLLHDCQFVDNKNGSHTGTCVRCGEEYKEKHHFYEEGEECFCGAEHSCKGYEIKYQAYFYGHEKMCSICGAIIGDSEEHQLNEDGICIVCDYNSRCPHNVYIYKNADKESHEVICKLCGFIISYSTHYKFCDSSTNRCMDCGAEDVDLVPIHHIVSYEKDETGHTMKCYSCGYQGTREEHDFSGGSEICQCLYMLPGRKHEHYAECSAPERCMFCLQEFPNLQVGSHTPNVNDVKDLKNGFHAFSCYQCGKYVLPDIHYYINGVCKYCGSAHTCVNYQTELTGIDMSMHMVTCSKCLGRIEDTEYFHDFDEKGFCKECGLADSNGCSHDTYVYKPINSDIHSINCGGCKWIFEYEFHTLDSSGSCIYCHGSSQVSIRFESSELRIKAGQSAEIKADITPSGTKVKWSSSNNAVATVDEKGVVTAVKRGSAVITCESATDSSVKATCDVSVEFNDIENLSSSFQNAINWMADQGIASGTSDGGFGQNSACTRKQFAIMLWGLAGKPAVSGSMNFTDCKDYSKSSGTYKAILWASQGGIVGGYKDGTFRPDGLVTRQQVMIMLYRYAGKPAVSGKLAFTDVTAKAGTDTYNAILWGSKAGITGGTSKTTFSPNDSCLRRQIALFMYRFAH